MRHGVIRFLAIAVTLAAAIALADILPADDAVSSGDAAFDAQVDRFVEEGFRLSPESATSAGDHRFDARASDLSGRGIEALIRHASVWKERFSQIDPKTLSPAREADREWMVANCDEELLGLEELRSWQKTPGTYLPTAGIYALVERNFAPLAERMHSVTLRETAALLNLDAARQNLRPETVPKIAVEIALAQMPGTLAFFKKDLPAAFAALSDDAAKRAFAEANNRTLNAIEAYQKWLKDTLEPRAAGNFALGEHAYRRMLADDDMVDIPLAQLEEVGERELARLQKAFAETAAKIDSKKSPADVLDALSRNHPLADQVIPAVAAGLAAIRAYVVAHHIATIPSEVAPIVRETPPYMRATTFASMDSPGPLEKATEAYFNVTIPDPSWSTEKQEQLLRLYSAPTISDLSVHEVYPGHYVQFLDNRLIADKARTLFGSGADVEGWALYCEEMMLDEGLRGGDPAYRLAQIQMALQRACRYLVAIRMHTRGMTVDEAARFFERNAYMTPHNAMVEALRGTEDPGYLRYQLGKLMILKLREDVRKKEGAGFDLGRFHDRFLSQGAIPIRLIRRAMLGSDGPLL